MASGKSSGQTLHYIPHTHWEGAVFFTREEYLEMGLPHILTFLNLAEKQPNYTFVLDQVAYIKPFLERYPEEAERFHKLIKEGRLEIVGGMDVMPDVVKPGGELFVRQMLYGKTWCREVLGVDVKTAWLLDTFGHHPQMPQLLRQAGFESFWFLRGVPKRETPAEFIWQGLDGTSIPAFWLPFAYGPLHGVPTNVEAAAEHFRNFWNEMEPFASGSERVGLDGPDVCPPEEHVPALVSEINNAPDRPLTILYSTPSNYAGIVAKRQDIPVITGDFNPIFRGTYSSRIELHQATRAIEQKLLTAEKLAALSSWLGTPVDDKKLWQAWEPLMFNQAHDLASGVMTDPVYEDTVRSYYFSERLADELIAEHWQSVAASIDTTGDGAPLVVFNPLGWSRTDVVEADLGFAGVGVHDFSILDPAGEAVPAQVTSEERYADGSLKRANVCFVARDIPALGYSTYRVIHGTQASQITKTASPVSGSTVENEFCEVTFDLTTGAITSIIDKSTGTEVLAGPANVIARQEDRGDLWEPYHALNAGMDVRGAEQQPVPTAENALLTTSCPGGEGTIVRGPAFSEFRFENAFGSGTFTTRIRLYQGLRRVDIQTELVNNERHVRYQALFPTAIRDGVNTHDIQFGAIERPIGVENPAQTWADYGDGERGVALLNAGMPGNVVNDNTLILSLLRSVDLIAYNEGRPSESGYELGVKRTFRYALIPHEEDWRGAGIHRQGPEFNCPLLARKVPKHPGSLPRQWGIVEVSHPNVIMSTLRPGPDGTTVLRVYETFGQEAKDVEIKLNASVMAAQATDLLEREGRALKVKDDTLQIDLHPFEIATIKLKLRPAQ